MIKPEIGMPVLYHQHPDDHFPMGMVCAGVIARVWHDDCVNIAIFDGNGLVQNRTSVLLHQGDDGEPNPAGGRWCQFPNWFVAFTKPPMVIVNPSAIDQSELDSLRPGHVLVLRNQQFFAGPAVVPPAATDRVQCGTHELVGLNAERPDFQPALQPTSQVLG